MGEVLSAEEWNAAMQTASMLGAAPSDQRTQAKAKMKDHDLALRAEVTALRAALTDLVHALDYQTFHREDVMLDRARALLVPENGESRG